MDWSFPPGSNPTTKRLMQNSAILRVRSVESGDAGVYTCSASGVGTFTATLSIAGECMRTLLIVCVHCYHCRVVTDIV